MKCLLVSDLHYALPQYDWIIDQAHHFDVVVLGGDHINIAGHVDGNAQIIVLLKIFERIKEKTQLIVCSGNHDLNARNEAGEKVALWMDQVRAQDIPTDGDSFQLGETLFTICPWWDGPNTRQDVDDLLKRDAAREKKSWVWVYHAPPANSPTSLARNRSFGDQELTDWIDTYGPDIVLSGHIHEAPFENAGSWVDRIGGTWVFNAGRQIGPIPAHIAFDTNAGEALWFSIAGSEFADLKVPAQPLADSLTKPLTGMPAWF